MTRDVDPTAQKAYWESPPSRYRTADDPVTMAFARPKVERILAHIPDKDRGSLLDVGAGNGTFSLQWSRRFRTVVATDLSGAFISSCPLDRRVQADAIRLPFPDSAFDTVFESNLLHHLPDPGLAVQEMRRVARRWVALVEPNRANPPMFAFSLLVKEERGGLRSSPRHLLTLAGRAGLEPVFCAPAGLIYQNLTPRFAVRMLRPFDIRFPWGAYITALFRVPS